MRNNKEDRTKKKPRNEERKQMQIDEDKQKQINKK